MKYLRITAYLTITACILIFALSAVSAQQTATSRSKAQNATNTSANAGDKGLVASGTAVNAELVSAVDARKSRVGDQVVLKTRESIRNSDQRIEKGARLIGRITEIQQKTKENGQSRIGMIFERIEGKNISAPISLSIVSISNPRAAASSGDAFGGDMAASSSSSATGSSVGLLGGVGKTVGGVVNTAAQATGSVVGATTQTVAGTAGTLGRTIGGIHISNSARGSVSGSTTLSSENKNLRLAQGTTFNVTFNSEVRN